MPRLIVIKGADEGKTFELDAESLVIGRDSGTPIRLHDTEVSRRHAEIRRQPSGGFLLVDLASANGTFVNTQRATEVVLQPGDHVQLGQTILVFSLGRNAAAPTSDLADRIRLVAKQDLALSSAIIKTIGEDRGSEILKKPEAAGTERLRSRLANLGVVYETIQAISHILDVDQLLDRILELIFRSIEADHGCILLRDVETGNYVPKTVRSRDAVPGHETIAVSRTIVEHVLREREGLLVSDPANDDRFSTGESIARYNIREAICVPMKGRHETVGVLFLDVMSSARDAIDRGQATGKFDEDDLDLAIAIAHQAALAVEETRYHQALVHAERLAAIGQTIAALSHHIKNIMQGVVFGSDMVRTALADKDDGLLHKGWRLVEKNQGKIHELVLDMLSYSKEREPAIEMFDLNRLVDDVVDVVRGRAAEGGVQLEVRHAANLPPVPADPEGIHRATLNVVSNALDAVEGRPNPFVGVQTLLEPDGQWVKIVVLDHGVGIPPDKLGEIFKPFVSTKGARGTGLGLAVSRKILREHGGDVQVQSQVGKGSKFVLRLPMRSAFAADGVGGRADTLYLQPPRPDEG